MQNEVTVLAVLKKKTAGKDMVYVVNRQTHRLTLNIEHHYELYTRLQQTSNSNLRPSTLVLRPVLPDHSPLIAHMDHMDVCTSRL